MKIQSGPARLSPPGPWPTPLRGADMDDTTRKKKFGRTRAEHAAYMREWRRRNPDKFRAAQDRYRQGRFRELKLLKKIASAERRIASGQPLTRAFGFSKLRFLRAIKQTAGCLDCGRCDGTLHFDHRGDSTREFHLADFKGRTWLELVDELAKCDVRCGSCHARRHLKDIAPGVRKPYGPTEAQMRAYGKVKRALEKGLLVRPDSCSRCGVVCKVIAHHADYFKPLEVEWICRRCHRYQHGQHLRGGPAWTNA